MAQEFKSGQVVQKSGTYTLCDKNGVEFTGLEIILKAGDIFPPPEKDGQYYFLSE